MKRIFQLATLLCLALSSTACGDDEPAPHGLTLPGVESRPVGEPVQIRYELEDGETWTADVFLEVRQTQPTRAGSKSTITLDQVFHAGDAPHTTTEMRFVRVESSQRDVEPPEGVTAGHIAHAPGGKPRPETRTLTGENIGLADTVYGSMMMTGLGGSPTWVPDRPVREGEAWPAETVLSPRMVALLLQQERKAGAAIPKPVFRGSVHVDRIERDAGGGGRVVVSIAALIEVKGEMVQGRERGRIDMGYQVDGTATIDIRTGIPTQIDATAAFRMDSTTRDGRYARVLDLTLRAEARRVAR